MGTVIARSKGYVGGVIREPGDIFEWPEKQKVGSWVEPMKTAPAPKPAAIPEDWKAGTPAGRQALASQLSGKEVITAKEADAIISAYALVNQFQPEPFAEPPAPETVAGNGVVDALGGPAPDWLAPGPDATPKAVTE